MSMVLTKLTTSAFDKWEPLLQVVDGKIYYVWMESDAGGKSQLWAAVSDMDGSNFVPTKLTTSAFSKYEVDMQVVGDTIYYAWEEHDGSKYQIWTAVSNLGGSGFVPTKQTTSNYQKFAPQLQVVGNTIYYAWEESDALPKYQIWTAVSNLDGSGFVPTKQTTSNYQKHSPQFQVVGSNIYYVWWEDDAVPKRQIWTAVSDLDGSGFVATKQTTSAYAKWTQQLQVAGDKIYYVWREYDGALNQIWTAVSDLDGSNFVPTKQTTSAYEKHMPQLQVLKKIYYIWVEHDAVPKYQIWTAVSNLDGSNFVPTKQTTSAYGKYNPQLEVVGSNIYYAWYEYDAGGDGQIWLGYEKGVIPSAKGMDPIFNLMF